MHMMDLYNKLRESAVFQQFQRQHSDYYLTHFFILLDELKQSPWQIGYYSKEKDRMLCFEIDPETGSVEQGMEEEVFKKEETVEPLEFKHVMDFAEALAVAEKFQRAQYPKEVVNQKICILQCLSQGVVWNMTFVSAQLNVFNIKLKASTGEILHHTMESVLRFRKE